MDGNTWADLARLLADQGVDAMVCGGISGATRESIQSRDVDIIDNVAGTSDEVVEALRRGRLRSGFGFSETIRPLEADPGDMKVDDGVAGLSAADGPLDCLTCQDRGCLAGRQCPTLASLGPRHVTPDATRILEAAVDVACEEERTLCRLAELVYFALGMGYRTLGIAYCVDLTEPTRILARELRRFFNVVPRCCKGAGVLLGDGAAGTSCDPWGQAAVLNHVGTDLNVAVGLCVGVDAIFARQSQAPVSTIFVKDKSLANNPIGAVYSHYHLREI
jgi:uncharacterized metal-binding protein